MEQKSRVSLRPYQRDAIDFVLRRSDKRAILAHAPSAGKTLTSIVFHAAPPIEPCLVACPAVARGTWVREYAKWSDRLASPILYGRDRKRLTKAQSKAREEAYSAQVQIVSYNLLKEMDPAPRGLLVLDEVHALRSPLSRQSKIVRAFTRAHPQMPILALTATPIPTDVKQLWNVLDTLFPGQFGKASATGEASWSFLSSYCQRFENEYGVSYSGSKSPEALAALALRLKPYMHRVTDKEVAPYLPPLNAQPLWIDERRQPADIAKEWLELEASRGSTHQAVVCFNREQAWDLAHALGSKYVLTGEFTAEQRAATIAACATQPEAVLVATCESIRESISLSFCQSALIFQWRTSPAQAIQLMGRFRRQDAKDLTTPVRIEYVVMPGEERRAEMLVKRISDIQALMAADSGSELLQEVFKPRQLDEAQERELMTQMLSGFSADWADWQGDDDE